MEIDLGAARRNGRARCECIHGLPSKLQVVGCFGGSLFACHLAAETILKSPPATLGWQVAAAERRCRHEHSNGCFVHAPLNLQIGVVA